MEAITEPTESVNPLSYENRRARCLALDEIKEFWHGIDDTGNTATSPATKSAPKFQLVTTQRKDEIITAKWNDFELNTGWWTIPCESTK